ncbi:MAG: septal ring lytic transglycosylase RlpA family protein, partial [Brachymonas sp.]|nr:septal ring lytic transglycosylase RlpA family protein [Brachymonas sp.]
FHNRLTANGERYNMNALTAAHRTLPFGTMVLVKNTATGKTVTVRINDRGPYIKGRIIDLSRAAARELGISGIQRVALYKQPAKAGKKAMATKISSAKLRSH